MKPLAHASTSLTVALFLFLAAGSRPVLAQAEADSPPATPAPSLINGEATNEAAAVPAPPEPPAPDQFDGYHHRDRPHLFSDFVLEAGKTNFGDSVVVKGASLIDGVLDGDSVTIYGNAKLNGVVGHDLVVVMGSANLGPEAQVHGDVVVVGGKLTRATGAKVQGDTVEVDPDKVPGLGGAVPWITRGLLLGRPLPFGVAWVWVVAGVFLLTNLLLLVIFPRPLQACVDVVERRPIGSFFAGILVNLLFGLLCVLSVVSVVGIAVMPFLLVAFIAAFFFGKITIYRYVGQQLGRQVRLGFLQAPAVALILGTVVFYLVYAVPFLGFVAWGFTSIFGLGAVSMTAIQKFRDELTKSFPARVAEPPAAPPITPGSFPPPGDATAAPPPFATAPRSDAAVWPRAGFWVRLCALVLDLILVLVPMQFLDRDTFQHFGPLPFFLVWLAYFVVLWTWKGTTIGGIILGIKVIRLDGRPLDFAVSLIRALASILSAFALGLGFFWAGFSREKQSWHDKVAGTVMVRVPHGMSLI